MSTTMSKSSDEPFRRVEVITSVQPFWQSRSLRPSGWLHDSNGWAAELCALKGQSVLLHDPEVRLALAMGLPSLRLCADSAKPSPGVPRRKRSCPAA